MGSSTSLFWSSSNDNAVDPATGLTGRQKKLVRNTWDIVRKDPVASGVAIMYTFFKKHPQYQEYFPAFKNVAQEELPENKRFQAHCTNVIYALNNVIDHINDPALMECTLISIGEKHDRRGQKKEHFHDLKEVIMEVLRQKLGSKFTPETAEAWSKTIDAAYINIFKGFST